MSKSNTAPIVLTLDAGGTNFVFTAIQDYKKVSSSVRYLSNSDDLEKCLQIIIKGFEEIKDEVKGNVTAISFAFPGPADYQNGVIGDLPNFKAFSGAVPLAAILEDQFKVPVFINNDGDLFAYGEAQFGYLPYVNQKMESADNKKRYKNLIGITLGTGLGCGIVVNGNLLRGDNSCGAEIHNTSNVFNTNWNAEASVSKNALQQIYNQTAGIEHHEILSPYTIYQIAKGHVEGSRNAAIKSFEKYGKALGNVIVNVITLIDGIVVIGGGIRKGWDLISPSLFQEINRSYLSSNDQKRDRLSFNVFNLEENQSFVDFVKPTTTKILVPGSNREVSYEPQPRLGIGLSKLGANTAIAFGAYAFARQQLDNNKL